MMPIHSSVTLFILVTLISVILKTDAWTTNLRAPPIRGARMLTLLRASAEQEQPRQQGSAFTDNSKDPFDGLSNLIDDGKGNIRADLASSIWNWDNDHRTNEHLPKFEYSTRAGLRLVDEIAKNLLETTTGNSNDAHYNGRTSTTYSDLVQEGVVALMYAMATYKENASSGEVFFEEYARRNILASLTKVMAQDSRPIQLPPHVMELLKNAKLKRQELLTETGREPTMTQVATELNVSPQQLELYQMFGSTLSVERTMEIYDPLLENKATFADTDTWQAQHGIGDVDDSNIEILEEQEEEGEDEMWLHLESVTAPLKDMIVDQDVFDNPNDLLVSNMIHDDVQEFLKETLDEKEYQVIELRYGLDGKSMSFGDVGSVLGMSETRVVEIEECAMNKLRSTYTNRRQVETYLDETTSQENE